MIGYKSFTAKPAEVDNNWYVIDAENKILGHLASEVAHRLRGKHKTIFTPHVDCGDNIIVINADKIKVTGKKVTDKKYYRYTGYVGNLKTFSFEQMMKRSSAKVIELAVKGMIPRGPLGRATFKKLKVYSGSEHGHEAQKPTTLTL